MISNSTSSAISVPSPDINIDFPQKIIETMPTINISRRLALRKELHSRLASLSDMMCFVGLFGVVLMIIRTEIIFPQAYHQDTTLSWYIRLMITMSTVVLIILILTYHHLDLTLHAVNNCVNDWRVGLTINKVFLILFEIIICAIHPLPRSFPNYIPPMMNTPISISTTPYPTFIYYTSPDIVLGLFMFTRLYLLCRFIVYHSHLVHDTSCQSIGYLNKVSINFYFVIKTYLDKWPARCLIVFCILIFLIGSWCLRACDYEPGIEHLPIGDAMWLFVVTFTTVGYGDIIPLTYCGRSIASIISIIGICLSALLITVLAQKLTLTRWEKYVHNFVLNTELAKQHKIQAANIIKYALKIWSWEKKHKSLSNFKHLDAQRKLFRAISSIHHIKHEQRRLIDNNIDLPEMLTLQRNTNTNTDRTILKMASLEVKIDHLEEQINNVNHTIYSIQTTLDRLVDKITK